MSNINQIDNELNVLRIKLTLLEEQKKIEEQKEFDLLNNPLKTLETIIKDKRKKLENGRCGGYKEEKEKVATLEPIFNMFKNIQERLEVLENKN
jgi:hypothetical protein